MLLGVYYLLFYSVGVTALVYSSILFAIRRDPLMGRFAACTLAMTMIVVASSLLNFMGDAGGAAGRNALLMANLAAAAVFSFLLVDFTAAVFPFKASKNLNRAVLFAAAAVLIIYAAARILGAPDYWDIIVLAFKDAAIIASTIIILGSRDKAGTSFKKFFRIVALVTAVLMPFIFWEEILGRFGAFPISAEGPLFLPAIYGIWAAVFLTVNLKERFAIQHALSEPDAAFLARYDVSQREADVLRLLLRGKSYKQIMTDLTIAMPTVKSHVASLYRKTGTANRVELSFKIAAECRETPRAPME